MNNLNEIPHRCQKCQYRGLAEPPYSCYACEEKYRKSEEEKSITNKLKSVIPY